MNVSKYFDLKLVFRSLLSLPVRPPRVENLLVLHHYSFVDLDRVALGFDMGSSGAMDDVRSKICAEERTTT
jgi:hypothetical protein